VIDPIMRMSFLTVDEGKEEEGHGRRRREEGGGGGGRRVAFHDGVVCT